VTATQSHRRSPACFPPVSSTLACVSASTRAHVFVGLGQGGVHFLTEGGDAPRPPGHAEEVGENRGRLAHTEPKAAVEQATHRRQTRAERPVRQVRGRHERRTMGTAHPMTAMLDNLGRDRRDLPDLDTARLPHRRQRGVQRERAAGTLDRAMRDLSRDLVGTELEVGVARMALLPAAFPTRRLALEMGTRARWVARRGARPGLGQLSFQLGDCRLQRGHLIAQERNLALQEPDVGLGYRREGGPQFGGQGRLRVHGVILAPAHPPAYPL
jgi:hypothetical protein